MNNVKNKCLRDKKHIDKEFNMNKLMQLTKDFMNDEEGLTIVEYVIGAALLVAAFVAADPFDALSTKLNDVIETVPDSTTTP